MDDHSRAKEQFDVFLAECGISRDDCRGASLLELGFGNCLFLNECTKAGMNVTGLEVRPHTFEKARGSFPGLDLLLYDGGKIPLSDNSFDYAVSFQVLEHTVSPGDFLNECLRVLKPGGVMYHKFPNYKSFYEGHYKILWLPFLTKSAGRLYLKMFGKYTPYYESLSLTKPSTIKEFGEKHLGSIELITDGTKEFDRGFTPAQAAKIKNGFLRRIVSFAVNSKLLRNLICTTLIKTGMYYPLMIIARKRAKEMAVIM